MLGSRFWAIGCLVLGVGIFSLQDLIVGLISADYPVHQAMTIRSLVAAPLLLAMVAAGTGLRRMVSPRAPLLTLRGLINLVSYTSFYLGLAALPLATCVIVFFTAPLFITLLSALALGERVGPRRWAAVAVGFVGVLVMLRPGSDLFEWAALLPICAGLTYGTAQVVARKIGTVESAAVMAAYSNFVFLIGALAMAALFGGGAFANEAHASLGFLLRGWTMPTSTELVLMMSCGIIAAVALTLLSEASRSAPANTVAPFGLGAGMERSLWLGSLGRAPGCSRLAWHNDHHRRRPLCALSQIQVVSIPLPIWDFAGQQRGTTSSTALRRSRLGRSTFSNHSVPYSRPARVPDDPNSANSGPARPSRPNCAVEPLLQTDNG